MKHPVSLNNVQKIFSEFFNCNISELGKPVQQE